MPVKTQTMKENIPHPFSDRISLNSQVLWILENFTRKMSNPEAIHRGWLAHLERKKANIEHRSEPVEFVLVEMSAWSVKKLGFGGMKKFSVTDIIPKTAACPRVILSANVILMCHYRRSVSPFHLDAIR